MRFLGLGRWRFDHWVGARRVRGEALRGGFQRKGAEKVDDLLRRTR